MSAWGEHYCKIEIRLGAPQDHRRYTATLNNQRVSISGPAGMSDAVPLPLSPAIGCALLPQALALDRLAQGAAALGTDPLGRPASLGWARAGQAIALTYQSYQSAAGIAFAGSLTETVGGQSRITIQITSVSRQDLSAADFPVRAFRAPPTHGLAAGSGGGQ